LFINMENLDSNLINIQLEIFKFNFKFNLSAFYFSDYNAVDSVSYYMRTPFGPGFCPIFREFSSFVLSNMEI